MGRAILSSQRIGDRKAGDNPFLREMPIPFRGAGYVVLYEIKDAVHVTVLAVRHQLEDDYH